MEKDEAAEEKCRWLKKYFGITLRDENERTIESLQLKHDDAFKVRPFVPGEDQIPHFQKQKLGQSLAGMRASRNVPPFIAIAQSSYAGGLVATSCLASPQERDCFRTQTHQ